MTNYLKLTLVRRDVTCRARLLHEEAPRTCSAVWTGLQAPQENPAWHARHAGAEVYAPGPSFVNSQPPIENATVLPLPGDLIYFHRGATGQDRLDVRFEAFDPRVGVTNMAIFYGTSTQGNLLLAETFVKPGTLFAQIDEGLAGWASACEDLWLHGSGDERVRFERLELPTQ